MNILKFAGASHGSAACPVCNYNDTCLSIRPNPREPDGYKVWCKGHGCSPKSIKAAFRQQGFEPDAGTLDPLSPEERAEQRLQERRDRMAAAFVLYDQAKPPHTDTIPKYLKSRGLELDERLSSIVKEYFPDKATQKKGDRDDIYNQWRQMLWPVHQIAGERRICAVHRTPLDTQAFLFDGEGQPRRKTNGDVKDAAIKLDELDETRRLFVGEGVETTLTARQAGLRPAWALISSGGVRWMPVLDDVDEIYLLFEHDEADPDKPYDPPSSVGAVDAAARRWFAAGKRVFVVDPGKGDLNDVWNKHFAYAGRGAKVELARVGTTLEDADMAALSPELHTRGCRLYAVTEVTAVSGYWDRNDKGKMDAASVRNVRIALHQLDVELRYDAFADRMYVEGVPEFGDELDDAVVTRLWLRLNERFGFRPSKAFFWDALIASARERTYHPVKDYLAGLKWDGVARADRWLIDYGGADNTEFNKAIAKITLVAVVRRVVHPGTKFDELLVLEGLQDLLKSTALRKLMPNPRWFTDDFELGLTSKEIMEKTSGKLIIEISELSGMRKSDIDKVKAMLSRTHDLARPAYARVAKEVPRQFVLTASVNPKEDGTYLRDPTGNRRFWPCRIHRKFDVAAIERDRDQLWAEAVVLEARGERIWLTDELKEYAKKLQSDRLVRHPWDDLLRDKLGRFPVGKIRSEHVWTIVGMDAGKQRQEHKEALGHAMSLLGWRSGQFRFVSGGEREQGYAIGDAKTAPVIRAERDLAQGLRVFEGDGPDDEPWGEPPAQPEPATKH